MIGTILNALAIVVGGTIGLATRKNFSDVRQARLKIGIGAFTVYAGLATALNAFSGSFRHRLLQITVAVLALALGSVIGRACHLQKASNRLGRWAQQNVSDARSLSDSGKRSAGFVSCTILFCVGPLAILGALQEGFYGTYRTLLIKAVLDGLATTVFARVFGWGVLLSALPVLAWQGSMTLAAEWGEACLRDPRILGSIQLTSGLLVFCVALILLDLKRVAVADYLPSLICAPFLAIWML